MVDAGYINEEQAKGQSKGPPKPTQKPSNEMAERYYTDWVVDQLNDLIGTPGEDLIVETTLNAGLQNYITQTIDSVIAAHGEQKHITQGAMVLMRPGGAVVAMVGGRNYNASQFNRAAQALRPPGSSFKPIVYLAALEKGWDPQDIIEDAPITNWRYRPKNFGGKYYGEVTLEQALTYSMNTAAVRLMKEVGPDAVIDTARRLGIKADLEPDLSLGLGSSGIPLIEMATAYATIANGGLSVEPYGITKITSKSGTLYYERPPEQFEQRVFHPTDIQNITSMMHSVMEYGTGRGANFGRPAAGKTGTSQESRDALFMGFTRELVGSVWLGNDDNSPMKGVTGGSYPAQIWRQVMQKAQGQYRPFANADFQPASSFERLLEGLFWSNPANKRTPGEFNTRPIRPLRDKNSLPESRRYNN